MCVCVCVCVCADLVCSVSHGSCTTVFTIYMAVSGSALSRCHIRAHEVASMQLHSASSLLHVHVSNIIPVHGKGNAHYRNYCFSEMSLKAGEK